MLSFDHFRCAISAWIFLFLYWTGTAPHFFTVEGETTTSPPFNFSSETCTCSPIGLADSHTKLRPRSLITADRQMPSPGLVVTGSNRSLFFDLQGFYRVKSVSLFRFTRLLQGEISLPFSIFTVFTVWSDSFSFRFTGILHNRAIFVWPQKMVSVSVCYLFYQPMDEKIKTMPFRFPAERTLTWRRNCSIGQSCCSMMSKRSIGWFLKSYRAYTHFYPFDKPVKSLYFPSFVVSVLLARFHFTVIRKSRHLQGRS